MMPSTDQVAAVCYRKSKGAAEFLLVRSSSGRWLFPKGGVDEGEVNWRAAAREAHEEAGVSGKIDQQPFTTFKHLKRDLKLRGRELTVAAFLLKVERVYEPLEKHREPTWFKPEQAKSALSQERSFEYAEEYTRVIDEACSLINETPGEAQRVEEHRKEPDGTRVFVSYSHQDAKYLKDNSLLGHLSGLSSKGFRFWHDERIATGEPWDEIIQKEIDQASIALVLVSQAFLNSRYCQDCEVVKFVRARRESGLMIFPVILSPCDWKSHEWLASTQFQPRGGGTIETHFKDIGKRKALYAEIYKELEQLKGL